MLYRGEGVDILADRQYHDTAGVLPCAAPDPGAAGKETLDLAQRLSVARLLDEGEGYGAIREATGASSATISRVNKCYEYGSGGYRTVLERLKDEKNESKEKKG